MIVPELQAVQFEALKLGHPGQVGEVLVGQLLTAQIELLQKGGVHRLDEVSGRFGGLLLE